MNVRCRDVFEQRSRLGSRPGLVKAFGQLLGGATIESFDVVFSCPTLPCTTIEDTYLQDTTPTTNNGAGNLNVGVLTGPIIRRTIIHVNLSTIPASATIVSASLSVTNPFNTVSPNFPGKIRRLTTQAWVELEATWNRASNALAWTTPGGDYTTVGELDVVLPWSVSVGYTFFGLGPLVQDAYTNWGKQLHIIIMNTDEASIGHSVTFRSKNYVGVVSQRPVLSVTYEVTS
jgi:hypothetical protein